MALGAMTVRALRSMALGAMTVVAGRSRRAVYSLTSR